MSLAIINTLWRYRGFVLGNVKREFQSKYKNSLLGAAWNILNPLSMIIVYTVIFSKVMKAKLPNIDDTFSYSIYLCAGLLIWGLFTEISLRSQNIFIENANLIKKINFPKLCLPTIIVINALINFIIIFSLFTAFLIISGTFPGIVFIGLLPIIIVTILFSIGLGITIGVLNVFFKDVGQLFSMLIQFWFWFTPIVYTPSVLPTRIKDILFYNPMFGIVNACQKILVEHTWPDVHTLIYPTVTSVILLALGFKLFKDHSDEIVDEI